MDKVKGEIDIVNVVKKIWFNRKRIFKTVIVFVILGIIVAVMSPVEYSSKAVVIPEKTEGNLGGSLGGLAALAGVNINQNNSKSISPKVYSKIVNSIPFKLELMNTIITVSKLNKKTTFKEYYLNHKKEGILDKVKKYTIGLPNVIKAAFTKPKEGVKTKQTFKLTKEEYNLCKIIEERTFLNYNIKNNTLELSFSMPEAESSAEMTIKLQELLQEKVIEFESKKAKEKLNFLTKRYNEKKEDFEKKQYRLVSFQDKNRGFMTERSKVLLKRYTSETSVAEKVLSELAVQVENQEIIVKQDTPIFTVIEPVMIPINKSKPNRLKIVLIYAFLGLIVGGLRIYYKDFLKLIKEEID